MNKMLTLSFMSFLFLIQCSSDTQDGSSHIKIHENAVTLDLRFGDDEENLDSDFILARPRAIRISKDGDILVLDEDRIKVYDQKGNGIRLVGKRGQGPREFEGVYRLHTGPAGHISVKGWSSITLLNPELEYVHKKSYDSSKYFGRLKKEEHWRTGIAQYAVYIDENERFIFVNGSKMSDKPGSSTSEEYKVLIHEKDMNSKVISKFVQGYKNKFSVNSDQGYVSIGFHFEFFGDFLWNVIDKNRIVYIDTGKDYAKSRNSGTYNITIQSLNDSAKHYVTHPYDLIPIQDNDEFPPKDPDEFSDIPGFNKGTYDRFVNEVFGYRDQKVHCAPLQALLVDGKFLFAFTYKTNSVGEIFTDIFNLETLEYVSSLYFPKVPRVISNSKAYYLGRVDEDSFYTVGVFSIDSRVYAADIH